MFNSLTNWGGKKLDKMVEGEKALSKQEWAKKTEKIKRMVEEEMQ